jgi:hypothetical protein
MCVSCVSVVLDEHIHEYVQDQESFCQLRTENSGYLCDGAYLKHDLLCPCLEYFPPPQTVLLEVYNV